MVHYLQALSLRHSDQFAAVYHRTDKFVQQFMRKIIFCCYAKCILSGKRGMEMLCDKRWRNWFRILLKVVRREAKKLMFFDRLQHCPRVKSINARQQGTGRGLGCQKKLFKNRRKDFFWPFALALRYFKRNQKQERLFLISMPGYQPRAVQLLPVPQLFYRTWSFAFRCGTKQLVYLECLINWAA